MQKKKERKLLLSFSPRSHCIPICALRWALKGQTMTMQNATCSNLPENQHDSTTFSGRLLSLFTGAYPPMKIGAFYVIPLLTLTFELLSLKVTWLLFLGPLCCHNNGGRKFGAVFAAAAAAGWLILLENRRAAFPQVTTSAARAWSGCVLSPEERQRTFKTGFLKSHLAFIFWTYDAVMVVKSLGQFLLAIEQKA